MQFWGDSLKDIELIRLPSQLQEGQKISLIRGNTEILFCREYGQLQATIGPIPPVVHGEVGPQDIDAEQKYHDQLINVYFEAEEQYDSLYLAVRDSLTRPSKKE